MQKSKQYLKSYSLTTKMVSTNWYSCIELGLLTLVIVFVA